MLVKCLRLWYHVLMAKLYANVVFRGEIMMEFEDQEAPTCAKLRDGISEKMVRDHLKTGSMWLRVENIDVIHWVKE